jgi:hypothetical protein
MVLVYACFGVSLLVRETGGWARLRFKENWNIRYSIYDPLNQSMDGRLTGVGSSLIYPYLVGYRSASDSYS